MLWQQIHAVSFHFVHQHKINSFGCIYICNNVKISSTSNKSIVAYVLLQHLWSWKTQRQITSKFTFSLLSNKWWISWNRERLFTLGSYVMCVCVCVYSIFSMLHIPFFYVIFHRRCGLIIVFSWILFLHIHKSHRIPFFGVRIHSTVSFSLVFELRQQWKLLCWFKMHYVLFRVSKNNICKSFGWITFDIPWII